MSIRHIAVPTMGYSRSLTVFLYILLNVLLPLHADEESAQLGEQTVAAINNVPQNADESGLSVSDHNEIKAATNEQMAEKYFDINRMVFNLTLGQTRNFTLIKKADRINVTNAGIADLFFPEPTVLSISGRSSGKTSLLIRYKDGSTGVITVIVSDFDALSPDVTVSYLKEALKDVTGLEYTSDNDTVVITGKTDPRNRNTIKQIISLFENNIRDNVIYQKDSEIILDTNEKDKSVVVLNESPSNEATQKLADDLRFSRMAGNSIQVDVEIIEINRTQMKDLGVSWFPDGGSWRLTASSKLSGTGHNHLKTDNLLSLDNITAQIRFLEQDGIATIVATPKLTVQSGKKASILVGGEVPITNTTAFSTNVEYKNYGTEIEITPEIKTPEDILVNLTARLRTPDYSRTINGYPSFLTKEALTTVLAKNKKTFALAGLIKRDFSKNNQAVPLLGKLPFIGILFKSKSSKYDDTETMVVMTPTIIETTTSTELQTSTIPSTRILEVLNNK
jgi:Flp pilus assembly secretin CpaC